MKKAEYKSLRDLGRRGVSKDGDDRSVNGMEKRAGSKLSRKAAEHRLGAPYGRQVYPH